MKPQVLAKRTPLFVEGQRWDGVLVVDQGRVRSFYMTSAGRDATHLVSGPGAVLGLVSVMMDEPAIVSMETLDEVCARHIKRPALMALVDAVPRLSLNFSRIIASLYTESVMRGRRSVESAPVRLGRVLCKLAALEPGHKGSGAMGETIHDLTQEDLASMVGTTRSWVAQILAHFQDLGLLERRRGAIRIPDLSALLDHCTSLAAQPHR